MNKEEITAALLSSLKRLEFLPFQEKEPENPKEFRHLLKQHYLSLAWLCHPDQQGNKESFQTLSENYTFLKNYSESHFIEIKTLLIEYSGVKETILFHTDFEKADLFNEYKKASEAYTLALEKYYKKANSVILDPLNPAFKVLTQNLTEIKTHLARILKKDPASQFTQDIVEKIARINVWLRDS